MGKSMVKWLSFLVLIPLSVLADVINIKESAPEVYEVKKGDTLWDISSLYLDKPWLWPELWRNNVHITNPHLIYPGDEIRLRFDEQGQPVMELVREEPKPVISLSPEGKKVVKQPIPVGVVSWSIIKPFVEKAFVLSEQDYERMPYLLGNYDGAVRFASGDVVLSKTGFEQHDSYQVVRKTQEIRDANGEVLGLQIRHVADASVVESPKDDQVLVRVEESNLEAKRGDRLMPWQAFSAEDMRFEPGTGQRGAIVANLENHNLLGKYNVVVVDLGEQDVSPGTVLGIYQQGPKLYDADTPLYEHESNPMRSAFGEGNEIQQPAIKHGDLVIFKTFENASYGLITNATMVIRNGAIVASP